MLKRFSSSLTTTFSIIQRISQVHIKRNNYLLLNAYVLLNTNIQKPKQYKNLISRSSVLLHGRFGSKRVPSTVQTATRRKNDHLFVIRKTFVFPQNKLEFLFTETTSHVLCISSNDCLQIDHRNARADAKNTFGQSGVWLEMEIWGEIYSGQWS